MNRKLESARSHNSYVYYELYSIIINYSDTKFQCDQNSLTIRVLNFVLEIFYMPFISKKVFNFGT